MSNDGERPEIPMELGLRVDILDNEGIWNTGRIVDVSRDDDDMVEVKYDGWGDEYNEWVSLAERRLAPLHMFTMVKKCWAKLTKWPWWPAFVVLRAPTCKTAAAALEQETKLYVEFFDSYDVEKRSRCWMQKKNIVSFQEGFDERASKNIGKNFPLFVEGTQRAIAGGSPVLFTGHGTLPIEFSSKYAAPLFQKKLELVDNDEERWYDAYRVFSDRYKVLYGYEYAVDSVSKVLAVRNAKTGSGKAASGKRVQSDDNDEEDEDDDVEIIEDVVAKNYVKKSVKTAPAPARPARDYPAKQPPQSVDDDDIEDAEESEEKEEPEEDAASDEDDEEEEEDDEEDEEPESPNGRRSVRLTKKRKQEEEDTLAARRTTRARRTKVLDQLVASSRATTAVPRRPASSPTPSSTSTASNSTTGVKSNFASASRRRRIYDEDDEGVEVVDLISSSRSVSPVKQVKRPMRALEQLVNAPISRQTEKKTEPAMLSAKHKESKSEVDKVESEPDLELSPTPHQSLSSTSRRKSTSPRFKNGDGALFTTTSANQGKAAVKTESLARADGLFRHWIGLGPSEDGTTRRNWSIQSWLMNGIRNKLSSEGKLNQ